MRTVILDEEIRKACEDTTKHIKIILKKHGRRSFSSRHELYGVLLEEVNELGQSIQKGNLDNIAHELKDVAQVCLFGLACINAKTLEW